MSPRDGHQDSRTHDGRDATHLAAVWVIVTVAVAFVFGVLTGLISTPGFGKPWHFSAAALVYAIFAFGIVATLLEGVWNVKRYRREAAAKQREHK
jgi:hypothetical protein